LASLQKILVLAWAKNPGKDTKAHAIESVKRGPGSAR